MRLNVLLAIPGFEIHLSPGIQIDGKPMIQGQAPFPEARIDPEALFPLFLSQRFHNG